MTNEVKNRLNEILKERKKEMEEKRARAIFMKQSPFDEEELRENAEYTAKLLQGRGETGRAKALQDLASLPAGQVDAGYKRSRGQHVEGTLFEAKRDERMYRKAVQLAGEARGF